MYNCDEARRFLKQVHSFHLKTNNNQSLYKSSDESKSKVSQIVDKDSDSLSLSSSRSTESKLTTEPESSDESNDNVSSCSISSSSSSSSSCSISSDDSLSETDNFCLNLSILSGNISEKQPIDLSIGRIKAKDGAPVAPDPSGSSVRQFSSTTSSAGRRQKGTPRKSLPRFDSKFRGVTFVMKTMLATRDQSFLEISSDFILDSNRRVKFEQKRSDSACTNHSGSLTSSSKPSISSYSSKLSSSKTNTSSYSSKLSSSSSSSRKTSTGSYSSSYSNSPLNSTSSSSTPVSSSSSSSSSSSRPSSSSSGNRPSSSSSDSRPSRSIRYNSSSRPSSSVGLQDALDEEQKLIRYSRYYNGSEKWSTNKMLSGLDDNNHFENSRSDASGNIVSNSSQTNRKNEETTEVKKADQFYSSTDANNNVTSIAVPGNKLLSESIVCCCSYCSKRAGGLREDILDTIKDRQWRKVSNILGKQCASCGTFKTPLWRDAEDKTPLCNACGIRYKKYRVRCGRCWRIPKKNSKWTWLCASCGYTLKTVPLLKNK